MIREKFECYKTFDDIKRDVEMNVKQTVDNLINGNKDNFAMSENRYDRGYAEGYHDALVDLLNQLGIEHDYEYYND